MLEFVCSRFKCLFHIYVLLNVTAFLVKLIIHTSYTCIVMLISEFITELATSRWNVAVFKA